MIYVVEIEIAVAGAREGSMLSKDAKDVCCLRSVKTLYCPSVGRTHVVEVGG